MIKGVGRGVLGLVVKPVVGLADAATDVLQGVQGTAGAATAAEALFQLRPKRAVYGGERRLRVYSAADAQAQLLLGRARERERGKRSSREGEKMEKDEWYCDFAELRKEGGGVVLLSTMRVLFIDEAGRLRHVLWWREGVLVEVVVPTGSHERTGVILHSQGGREGGPMRRFLVPCETVGHARIFKYKVEEALLSFRCLGGGGGEGEGGGGGRGERGGGRS